MKTLKHLLLVMAMTFGVAVQSQAQLFKNSYMNIDWQVGVPLGSTFADDASGWGMNFEGGYFLTPHFTVGAFINYQTNFCDIPRQTLSLPAGSALTVSQKHAAYQLPFGLTTRYNWCKKSMLQPYAGMKIGANYTEFSSYYSFFKQYTDTWGVYLSPEVGLSIFPRPETRIGIHIALYYSYSSNSGELLVYDFSNLNNFGLRLGISF